MQSNESRRKKRKSPQKRSRPHITQQTPSSNSGIESVEMPAEIQAQVIRILSDRGLIKGGEIVLPRVTSLEPV